MLSILFTACQKSGKELFSTEEPELQPLTLGIMPTLEGLPFLLAQRQGIYDSLGLKLNIQQFNSANERDAVFNSGKIEGMITDYPSAAIIYAHHSNICFVMKTEGCFCFIVSKGSQIRQISQLSSKNIAISRNTIVEYATDRLLDKNNIEVTTINRPEIGQIPLRLQMLQYGQIEASFLPDPIASIAMNNGHKSLISTQELGINLTGTAFSKKALTEKTTEIKYLIKGYNLAIEYIQTHPQKDWSSVLKELGIPEKLTGLIVLPAYKKAALPDIREMKNAIDWLKSRGRISRSYPALSLIDTTFIPTQTNPIEN